MNLKKTKFCLHVVSKQNLAEPHICFWVEGIYAASLGGGGGGHAHCTHTCHYYLKQGENLFLILSNEVLFYFFSLFLFPYSAVIFPEWCLKLNVSMFPVLASFAAPLMRFISIFPALCTSNFVPLLNTLTPPHSPHIQSCSTFKYSYPHSPTPQPLTPHHILSCHPSKIYANPHNPHSKKKSSDLWKGEGFAKK